MYVTDRASLSLFGTPDKPKPAQTIEIIVIFRQSRRVRVPKTVTIGPGKFVANCRRA